VIRSEIRKIISEAIRKKYGWSWLPDFKVEPSENPEHGDYSSNAAFVIISQLAKRAEEDAKPIRPAQAADKISTGDMLRGKINSPLDFAQILAQQLRSQTDLFEKVEVVPPGFINFWLSDEVLKNEAREILNKKENYGKGKKNKEKIQVEFISANPTGPIHIGNGRGAFLGDAIVKIFKFAGFDAKSEYYVNDARVSEQIKSLGMAAKGESDAYPYITDLYFKNNTELKSKLKKLTAAEAGYKMARFIQARNKKAVEKVLKIKFDAYFSEDSLYKNSAVDKVKKILSSRGLLYEKDGALWFKASQFGDTEDRVLIRSSGEPTYAMSDIAYHWAKFSLRKFDNVIDIWGADHHGYAPRLKAAVKALGIDENRLKIIITQFVRLVKKGKEIKMSKRKGEFITLEKLVKEVGLDAVRYFFLEKSPNTHMDFDLEFAKERSVKNPVYYIQYAHARIASIFRKVKNYKSKAPNFKFLKEKEELDLIKKLIQFPEIVEDTAGDYQVARLTRYAYEVAAAFHHFYERHRVITEDKNLTAGRLAIVRASQIVLRNSLGLLGISAPEKM
jgi:arginyl-tRNA synthetase